jgi:hypothetical protein
MFGFGLKDKAKKIIENDIGHYGPWSGWLSRIVSQGKKKGYNEYDVVVMYLLTQWEFDINHAITLESDKEHKDSLYKRIHIEKDNFNKIKHLVHSDLDYRERFDNIIKQSEELLK